VAVAIGQSAGKICEIIMIESFVLVRFLSLEIKIIVF
jgi:hypothetical protein